MTPGYWMNETGGALRPAIAAYLEGKPLDDEQIALIRDYLRQWIAALRGGAIGELKARVDKLVDRKSIREWLDDALDAGIDPL
jgi:hypothetical protein